MKKPTERLPELEYTYNTLLNYIPVGIGVSTYDGKAMVCNKAMLEMTGYSEEEIRQINLADIYQNPEDRALLLKKLQIEGIIRNFELAWKRKDGTPYYVNLSIVPFTLDGKDVHLAVAEDVTEKKCAEDARKESENRYRDLYDNAPVSYFSVGIDGLIKGSNRAAQFWLGYSADELKDMKLFDIYAEESKHKLKTLFTERFKRGIAFENEEMVYLKKDGQKVYGLLSASPIIDECGQVVASRSVVRDITKRKQAEAKCRAIIEIAIDGFLVNDLNGRLIEVNDSYCKMVGYMREELLKMSISDIEAIENPEDVFRLIKKLRKQGHARFETRYKCKDGKMIDVDVSANFLRLGEGQIFSFIRDITEHKQTEEALKRSESRLRLLSQKVITAQEEERTRIARELHDQLAQELVIIRREVVSLTNSLKGTAAYSRLSDLIGMIDRFFDSVHNISVELRPRMLDELGLRGVLYWYLQDFEHRTGIFCMLNISDSAIKEKEIGKGVMTTAYRILQEAMTNILKHSGADRVAIDVSSKNGVLTIVIADNGTGIDINRIKDNSSLGLLGMQERASLVGGNLEIQGNPSKGTKVIMHLPIQQSQLGNEGLDD